MKEGKMRKFADKQTIRQRTKNKGFNNWVHSNPLWILEGAGQLNTEGEAWILMKIGSGRNAWYVGNFYRENKKLWENGSEIENEQAQRLERFIESSECVARLSM